jgi:hypothetical protein
MSRIRNAEDSLAHQVQGLETILHALRTLYLSTGNRKVTAELRAQMKETAELLHVRAAALHGSRVLKKPATVGKAERQAVEKALAFLNGFSPGKRPVREVSRDLSRIALCFRRAPHSRASRG